MIYDWKMELYWRLPVSLQEAGLSLYARYLDRIFHGPDYEKCRQWLLGSHSWTHDYIEKWEIQRLQYILEVAATKVSYYQDKFKNIDWRRIKSKNNLHLLPTLKKQSLRNNENSFIVDHQNPKNLWCHKTSGTTGTSIRTYWPMPMIQQYQAFTEVMIRYRAGVSNHMPRCMMGGRPVIRGNTKKPPYWRYNKRWKQLYFSSYHVSKNNAADYINALKTYGSTWITGYGSAIAALAESASQQGLEPYPVRNIIVSGDTLSQSMRSSIEKYFQCRCFDFYGQSEGVNMAMECNNGKIHIVPMFGITEILREDGSSCEPGEIGEITATGLLNDAMPLIRYRLGDYGAWAKDQKCTCGNINPIITNLEGRVDDYLITSDGRMIGRLSTALKRSPSIHSAQIVQDKPGHAFLFVRPGDDYQRIHAVAVQNDILERIGDFDLVIIEVAEIPKTSQGKMLLVVRLEDRPAMKEIYAELMKDII